MKMSVRLKSCQLCARSVPLKERSDRLAATKIACVQRARILLIEVSFIMTLISFDDLVLDEAAEAVARQFFSATSRQTANNSAPAFSHENLCA